MAARLALLAAANELSLRSRAHPYTGPMPEEHLYDLYQRGMSLLESGDFEQATVPLSKAARLAPEKSSIREALGRAYFHSGRYPEAAREFEAVVERYPVHDFPH